MKKIRELLKSNLFKGDCLFVLSISIVLGTTFYLNRIAAVYLLGGMLFLFAMIISRKR